MNTATQNRLATIVKRELDAAEVLFMATDEATDEDGKTLTWDLGRGRHLVVAFDIPPEDPDDKRARLAALIESFPDLFAEVAADVPRPRPEPAEALKAELSALAGRTGALTAIVIDATSPVVWGASEAPSGTDDPEAESRLTAVFVRAHIAGISWLGLLRRPPAPPVLAERKEPEDPVVRPLRLVPRVDELAPLDVSDREELGRRVQLARVAIQRIRKHSLTELHRGEHLHEAVLEEGLGYLARSFATIYVLVLVYPGPFDELGAERAVARALPAIERLVVALPPDDSPTHRSGAVVTLRSRRKR
jgi:hypothetical protein